MLHTYRDQQERSYSANTKAGAKLINMSVNDTYLKSNYQKFQRYQEFDLSIAADPETTLPSLTEAVKRLATADRKRPFQDRGKTPRRCGAESARAREGGSHLRLEFESHQPAASFGRSLGAGQERGLGGGVEGVSWNYDKFYQRLRGGSAAGEGGQAPTAVGAALAHRKYGRLYVHLQKDGDLMYAPGRALDRGAQQDSAADGDAQQSRVSPGSHAHPAHGQSPSARSSKRPASAPRLVDPNIDYAKLAQSMGWYAEGPITNPNDLGPAVGRAIAVVKRGEPALLDTVTQPR